MTKNKKCDNLRFRERGMNMHISCIDVIDYKLQEAIKKIKLTSLQSPNLSFLGIHQEIIENDEKIKFYSLLPNMEEIIILKITSSDNEKNITC